MGTLFFTSPTGDGTTIQRGHGCHAKVYRLVVQREYLHLSVLLRSWVLVRPWESNLRPPALQSSALPTELILPQHCISCFCIFQRATQRTRILLNRNIESGGSCSASYIGYLVQYVFTESCWSHMCSHCRSRLFTICSYPIIQFSICPPHLLSHNKLFLTPKERGVNKWIDFCLGETACYLLTSTVICYWTDAWPHEMYLLNKMQIVNVDTNSFCILTYLWACQHLGVCIRKTCGKKIRQVGDWWISK